MSVKSIRNGDPENNTFMQGDKDQTGTKMSVQTSVEGVTANTGRHGEGQPSLRVASAHMEAGSSPHRQDGVDLTEQEPVEALARMKKMSHRARMPLM